LRFLVSCKRDPDRSLRQTGVKDAARIRTGRRGRSVVVIGERRERDESDTVGFFRDLFGFDNGSFIWGDLGLNSNHPGQVEVAVLGVTGGVPLDGESSPTIGVTIGVDVNPSDGSVGGGTAYGGEL
jgi:hypothetical protein